MAKQLTLSVDTVQHYINLVRRWAWTIATFILTIMLLGTVLRTAGAPRELMQLLWSPEGQALVWLAGGSWLLRP